MLGISLKRLALMITLAFLLVPTVSPVATADDPTTTHRVIIDQSNVYNPAYGGAWSIQQLGPVGQEFRPRLPLLNVVELYTGDGAQSYPPPPGYVVLQARIRVGGINMPIIGTSKPVTLPGGFSGITRFEFPKLVFMLPQRQYVIEVIALHGNNWMVAWYQDLARDTYPRGDAIVLGYKVKMADLWFREGIDTSLIR